MTFLNGILAFGSLAFTVPLAIHLLFRSRFRVIDWGAMYLLEPVVRINRRRIQLLHLLLLLLRCMLPVLLAFCLARPLLTGFQSLPGDAPQSLILVVDDSRSMDARDSTGRSRMDRVKQELGELLSNLSRRDEVMLIRSSQIDAPATSMSAQDAIAELRDLGSDFGPVDVGRLLQSAVDAADNASHAQRRIVVASDFQSQLVSEAAAETLNRMSSRLEEKSLRPVISFWNLGGGSNELANVYVESIRVDSPAVVAGRNASFAAEIHNASDQPVRDLRVVWSLDGQDLNPVTLDLPPRSAVTSPLSRIIDSVGVHEVGVAIEHGDALVNDNRRTIGVDVIREIRVLLIDGQPSDAPLEGETDFLSIALSPFAFGGEDQPDAVRTTVGTPSRMPRLMQTNRPDVVVLANVNKLQKPSRTLLAQFVLDGGGLIVFDGDQVNPDAYNDPWECESGSWRLPGSLGEIAGTPWGANQVTDPALFSVGERNQQYSPWNVLGRNDVQPFADVEVTAYRKLTIPEERLDGESPPIKLLELVNGDPIVLSAKCGRGSVIQFAIPCDTAWTNLPTRLVYLPILQQSVLDLAGSRKRTTIDVGQEFAIPVSEFDGAANSSERDTDSSNAANFFVELPNGEEQRLKPTEDATGQLIVSSNSGPGTYRIRRSVGNENGSQQALRVSRVVEVPASESELRDVDESRLVSVAGTVDAKVYSTLEQLQQDDRTRRYGREIWRWLLFGLLFVMVAELVIQQLTVRATTARVA